MTGSRVMSILLYWWIFPICGVASGRVCPYSLPSRLLFFFIENTNLCGIFFSAGSKHVLVRITGLSKKNNVFHFFFSGKVIYPQNLRAGTKKFSLPFHKYFFLYFLSDFLTYFLECQLNLS